MNHIGNEIRKTVNERKITKKEFAEMIGKSEQHIYNVFDNRHINTQLLEVITTALGVDMCYFFKYDDNKEIANNAEGNTSYSQVRQHGIINLSGTNNGNIHFLHENDLLKSKVQDLQEQIKLKDEIISSRDVIINLLQTTVLK